jgi:hypothetical protein
MKTFTNIAAQGDLLIRRIAELPANLHAMPVEEGKYVVAHSETGHNHVIEARPHVKAYTDKNDPFICYLEVIRQEEAWQVTLDHLRSYHTHESIAIDPGIYEIRRQREYTPQGWRRVED